MAFWTGLYCTLSFLTLFWQDPFFEVYIQFREYAAFVKAITALGGKVLVQKCPNGVLREAKIKVFHLFIISDH